MYSVLSNLRDKCIPLSFVQHIEIGVERFFKVTQPENGGIDSKPDTLNGGTMPVLIVGYIF